MPRKPKGLIGELRQARESLIRDHLAGMPGAVFVKRHSDWVEGVVRRLFAEALVRYPAMTSVCLVALGGFGRGELNLNSDVDLMFLYPPDTHQEMEKLAQQILYPLWDLGLDVSHSTRTIDDALEMAGKDFSALVAMLTARPLAGPTKLAEELAAALAESLAPPQAKRAFLDRVRAGDIERQKRFGHTPYLLEPHLKEGEGGLRDIHTITWVGLGCFGTGNLTGLADQGLIADEEVAFIGEARDFLWRVRNHLHYLAGGHDDRLTFEAQDKVAAFMEFKNEEGLSRAQRFMQAYYTRAFGLRNIRDLFFERASMRLESESRSGRPKTVKEDFISLGGKLWFADPDALDAEPEQMMRLFAVSAESGIKVSHQARQQVRRHLYLVDENFRRDETIRGLFYAALMPKRPEAGALTTMHHSGLLGAYLPETAGVFQLPQDDAYHLYTVDVHQLRTVDVLSALASHEDDGEALAAELLGQISRPRLLYLAALLHDVGKVEGKGHARRGAEMVKPLLKRLDLSDEEAGVVRFLIANHLFLSDTASRRDLHDEKMLFEAARLVGDEERLAMLYLLSIADGKATGPSAWTSWKSTLVKEFYIKTLAMLQRRDLDHLGSPEWLAGLREEVIALLGQRVPAEEAARRLDAMSDQYLLATEPPVIAEHIELQTQLKAGRRLVLKVEERSEAGYCQLTLVTRRRRGLFGRMAGVMTLNGLNILGAQIYNTVDKLSIVVFQVEFPRDPLTKAEKWAKVEQDMVRAVSGKLALAVRLAQKRGQLREPDRNLPLKPPTVELDNTVSDFHTVIEVAAYDRLGLLYDITQVMFELDLEIHLAKISTKVDQVLDVFYVTDRDGGKAEDPEQITEIKEALIAIL